MIDINDFDDIKKAVDARKRETREHPFDPAPPRERVPSLTYYDLYNKVTALPHQFREDFFRTKQVESLGGKIIQHVLATFDKN